MVSLRRQGTGSSKRVSLFVALVFFGGKVHAQASALSDAATQPAKGRIAWHEQARFERYELLGNDVDQWTIDTRLIYGLRKDVSLTLNVPTILRDRSVVSAAGVGDQEGFGDTTLMLKWRFWQHDPAPVDTNPS